MELKRRWNEVGAKITSWHWNGAGSKFTSWRSNGAGMEMEPRSQVCARLALGWSWSQDHKLSLDGTNGLV